jgi:hypothetical protein
MEGMMLRMFAISGGDEEASGGAEEVEGNLAPQAQRGRLRDRLTK